MTGEGACRYGETVNFHTHTHTHNPRSCIIRHKLSGSSTVTERATVNVWQELRRRRVFRVAGMYIVGTWLVIQVADMLFSASGLPETALRYLFIAAATGFPIALIFGWLYDVTPQGIVRTEPAAHDLAIDLSLKRTDYVILAALAAIGIAILLGSLGGIRDELNTETVVAKIEPRSNSIAVLPFTNLDTDPGTAYFSDGVTEEILHRLSTLGSLHVLATTSSFPFRDSDLSPADISGRLGVRYLLQGSVRRDADHIRVTARLSDEGGFQLWSDSFDRKLEGIFTIQTEIAHAVANHIVREIIPLQEQPDGRTTGNMKAYNAYLSGKAWLDQRTAGWQAQAEAAFRRAIELDPGYAPPYAGLAVTLIIGKGAGPHVQEARSLAETATKMDPEFAFGHAALGLIQISVAEYDNGLDSLRLATKLDPSLSLGWAWLAHGFRRLERFDEADEVEQRGLDVDPLNPILVLNASESAYYKGDFERAEALLRRLTTLPRPPVYVFENLASLHEFRGDFPQAIENAKQQIRIDADAVNLLRLAVRYARLGMFDQADYWYERGRRRLPAGVLRVDLSWEFGRYRGENSALIADLQQLEARATADNDDSPSPDFNQLLAGGRAFVLVGDYEQGIDFLERGIDGGIETWSKFKPPKDPMADIDPIAFLWDRWWYPGVTDLFTHLAFAYRQVGREDDARRILDTLAEQNWSSDNPESVPPPLWSDAYLATNLGQRALLQALRGDLDSALDDLRRAVELGWYAELGGYYDVLNDPAWAATIEQPTFQRVLARARSELDSQRSIVEATEAAHDFRAEFESSQINNIN